MSIGNRRGYKSQGEVPGERMQQKLVRVIQLVKVEREVPESEYH